MARLDSSLSAMVAQADARRCPSWRQMGAFMVVMGAWAGVAIGSEKAAADAPPSNAISYVVKSWRTGEGLPQNSVNAIAQTPDGYLWIGTRGGLTRFDGVRFTNYGTADGLKVPLVKALVEDGQGGLWIGTQGGGLSRWRNGVITTLTTADGLAHNVVLSLARARDGGLWVGTRRGLQHWGPGGFRPAGETEAMRGTIVAIADSPAEGVWFSVEGLGLCRYQGGRCENVEAMPKSRLHFPSSLLVDAQGDLWVGMGNAVVLRRHAGAWTEFNASHGVPFSYVCCLAQGRSGEIWAGSHMAGLYVFHDDRFNAVLDTDAAPRCVYVGPDGIVWVGTQGSGLFRLRQAAVTSLAVGTEPNRGSVYGLMEDPPGQLWACTYGGAVFRGSLDGRAPMQVVPNISTTPFMRTCLLMRDGTVYIAGTGCLTQRNSATGEIRNLKTTDDIRALCEGADGSLWIGTAKGTLKRVVEGELREVPHGNLGELIHGIVRGPGSALWVATGGAGLFRWDAGRVQRWTTADGLPTDIVRTLYQDAQGTLWIGTAGGGLAWLDNGRVLSVNARQGLVDDVVSQLLEDDLGNLWLGCNRGIFRVSKQELRDVAAGRADALHPLALDESDGMISAECTGGCSPAGLRSASGMLCFSTVRGIVAVDPTRFDSKARSPAAIIENVAVGGKRMPRVGGSLTLPAGSHDLEIAFTAFNYAKPEQLRFRHRLAGQAGAWSEAIGERSVRFIHLPPGDYLFEVGAANPDGRWSESPARLAFTVQPFYWQTTGFRVLIAVGVITGLGGTAWWLLHGNVRKHRTELAHQRSLVAAQERLSLAAEAAELGIWERDLVQGGFWANDQWRALYGFDQSNPLALEDVLQRVHPEDRESVTAQLVSAVTKGGMTEKEYRVVHPNGQLRWIAAVSRTICAIGGKPILMRGVALDITQRKRSELESQRQRNDLAHLSRVAMLGELAGSMAHELNQPLTAILSNAEAAQMFVERDNPDLAEIRHILDDIVLADKWAGDIIRRLRSLLKKEELTHEPLDLNEVLQEILKLMRSELVSHEITVETELARDLPRISGDRIQIQQVLINLIINGSDAMSQNAATDRQLVVRTESEDGHVKLSVIDSGCGIPAGMLEKVFESFVTTKASGIGLGLSVCRRIVDAHQGRIVAANNPGRGACFHVILPAVVGR